MNDNGKDDRGIRPIESVQAHKIIVGSSGWKYKIRRLSPGTVMGLLDGLLELADLKDPKEQVNQERLRKRLVENPKHLQRSENMTASVILAGLVEPALTDQDQVWALGQRDVMDLYHAILTLAGAGTEDAEEVGPLSEADVPSSEHTDSPDSTEDDPQTTSAN